MRERPKRIFRKWIGRGTGLVAHFAVSFMFCWWRNPNTKLFAKEKQNVFQIGYFRVVKFCFWLKKWRIRPKELPKQSFSGFFLARWLNVWATHIFYSTAWLKTNHFPFLSIGATDYPPVLPVTKPSKWYPKTNGAESARSIFKLVPPHSLHWCSKSFSAVAPFCAINTFKFMHAAEYICHKVGEKKRVVFCVYTRGQSMPKEIFAVCFGRADGFVSSLVGFWSQNIWR